MVADKAAKERARRAAVRARRAREDSITEPEPPPPSMLLPLGETTDVALRRRAAHTCAWCGGAIEVRPRGRIPTWCSTSCRRRAWEQKRAAESGRSAVTVVERRVEVPVAVPEWSLPSGIETPDWSRLLADLTRHLTTGRIPDHQVAGVASGLANATEAARRRLAR